MVIKSIKVGVINIYIPIPSVPKNLFVIILINIPNIFVINPPNNKIIVDFIKVFFICSPFNNMFLKSYNNFSLYFFINVI